MKCLNCGDPVKVHVFTSYNDAVDVRVDCGKWMDGICPVYYPEELQGTYNLAKWIQDRI